MGQENSPGCLARLGRGKEITLDGTGGWLLLVAAAWTVAVLERWSVERVMELVPILPCTEKFPVPQ